MIGRLLRSLGGQPLYGLRFDLRCNRRPYPRAQQAASLLMSAGVSAVWPLKLCALTKSLAGGATGGVFRSAGAPPLSTRAELIKAKPVNAIAMRGSFRPRERSCAASPANLCCHHLRKSSTSRVRGSSASTIEAPLPGGTCNCGGDLTSSGSVDSLQYGRVLERSERAVTEPDAEAVMRIRLCVVSWVAHRLGLSYARLLASGAQIRPD